MKKNHLYILSVIFIISSGVLYSFERYIAVFKWVGELTESSHFANPQLPYIYDNIYVLGFLILGILVFYIGYRK